MKLLGYQWLLLIVILISMLAIALSKKIGLCWLNISQTMCFILYFWLLFNLLVCFWELLIIEYKDRLGIPKTNFYLKEYELKDLLSPTFWIDGWNQYLKVDPRYANPNSSVFRYELFNVLVSFIPSIYVIYHLVSPNAILKQNELFNVFVFYSILQLSGASFYFASYFKKYGTQYIGLKYKEETIYLFLSLLWILIPLYLITNAF